MSVRVLLVESSEPFALGLKSILESTGEFSVVDAVEHSNQVVKKAVSVRPDVIVVSIRIPVIDRKNYPIDSDIELIRYLRERLPDTPILVMSPILDRRLLYKVVSAGASGFLQKDVSKEDLIGTLRTLKEGRVAFTHDQLSLIMGTISEGRDLLTRREFEILERIARGMSNAEIANDLHISEGTVRAHVSHILRKLDVSSRHQAVEEAYKRGLI